MNEWIKNGSLEVVFFMKGKVPYLYRLHYVTTPIR